LPTASVTTVLHRARQGKLRNGSVKGRRIKNHVLKSTKSQLPSWSLKCTLVRTVFFLAVHGRPTSDYPLEVRRLSLAGAPVCEQYRSGDFATAVEKVAFKVVSTELALFLNKPLQGLDIPSDFEVTFDGITVGHIYKSPRDSMIAIGVLLSHPQTGQIVDIYIDCPTAGIIRLSKRSTYEFNVFCLASNAC
jgi:hypothetical protein